MIIPAILEIVISCKRRLCLDFILILRQIRLLLLDVLHNV
jgi:hypothetical protein